MIEFRVTTGSNVPIYRQIVDAVRRGVATGALQDGEQLPSVRTLAEQLVVNPNTIARAFADLVREGILVSHAGKGLFVAPRRSVLSDEERARRLDAALEVFVHETLLLGFKRSEIVEALRIKLKEIDDAAMHNKSERQGADKAST
jgi:GntR family transcriptional regulator